MQIDSMIFDVDGTLWDTTEVVSMAWNKAAKEAGAESAHITAEILKGEFGKPMNVIADDLFPELDKEKKERLMELCCKYEHQFLEAWEADLCYSGVTDTIKKLSEKYRLFIVSNCQSGYIELYMKKNGLEKYIEDIECFGNTGKGKGENIRLVAERNQLENPVYVGDIQGDCDASGEAGVPFIHAGYGFGEVNECIKRIMSFEELLTL